MMYYQEAAVDGSSDSSSSSWGYTYEYVASAAVVSSSREALERIVRVVRGSAVVIFSTSSCCMCHAVKRLFCGMGVNPTVYELDQQVDPILRKEMERALLSLLCSMGGGGVGGGGSSSSVVNNNNNNKVVGQALLPVVFIGGKLVGPMDRVMGSHINGTLVPLLKDAGALWL